MRDYSFTFNTSEFAVLVEMLEEAVEKARQKVFSIGLDTEGQEVEPTKLRTFLEEVEARRGELAMREKILEIVKKEKL